MYKIRFVEVDGWIVTTKDLKNEIEQYFKLNTFEIPIFPYEGMVFDLSEYLDNNCTQEFKNLFKNYMGWEIQGIVFCKNHIDIYTDGPQCHLPIKKFSDTFPK